MTIYGQFAVAADTFSDEAVLGGPETCLPEGHASAGRTLIPRCGEDRRPIDERHWEPDVLPCAPLVVVQNSQVVPKLCAHGPGDWFRTVLDGLSFLMVLFKDQSHFG